jgi:UDP-N-acetylmuramate dehydrogenase
MMAALRSDPESGVMRGELEHNASLASLTSWRVGGPARQLYRPADREDLVAFVQQLPIGEPIFWLGLGSNVLIRDGGFPGTVIQARGVLDQLDIHTRQVDGEVTVGAGVACAQVARAAVRAGLAGAAFLAGIPGTLGGALAMNAGAHGHSIWEFVQSVEVLMRAGELQVYEPEDFEVAYRSVALRDEVALQSAIGFLSARLIFMQGHDDPTMRALLDHRAKTQPIGQATAGSTFRNPPGDHAGRLIEACGMKGVCVGDACISDKHANFIVNRGHASASDIERLMERAQRCVYDAFGVQLEPEVIVIGDVLAAAEVSP